MWDIYSTCQYVLLIDLFGVALFYKFSFKILHSLSYSVDGTSMIDQADF